MEAQPAKWTEEQLLRRQVLAERLSRVWHIGNLNLDRNQLTLEYNDITRKLLALNDRRVDPLFTFPVEIWLQIINEILCQDTLWRRIKALQQLTAVSTRWRRLLTCEPSFWTQIDTSNASLQRLIMLCIERSRETEISVKGYFEDSAWRINMGPIIVPHSKRIRKLVCCYWTCSTGRPTRLLELFPATPALKSLVMHLEHITTGDSTTYSRSVGEFIQQNPQLADIQGASLGMLQPDSHPQLISVSLGCEATQMIPILQTLPNLRSVSFCPMEHHGGPQSFDSVSLRWTEVSYLQRNFSEGIRLISQMRSTLRQLHFSVDAQHLRSFLETIISLKSLEILKIELVVTEISSLLLYPLIDDPPVGDSSVREVKVVLLPPVRSAMERKFRGDAQTFWDWLFSCIPNTETLSLPFVYQGTMVPLVKLQNLREFCCPTPIRYRLHEFERCCHLRELNIHCATLTFHMLSSETVRKLTITFTETYPIAFWDFMWPSLTDLDLRLAFDSTDKSITFDLPILRSITVHGKLQPVTAVTKSLACDAYKLPSLEQLSFPHWYPELDILFILLERRLLSRKLTPVLRLTLTDAIPAHIRLPLVDRVHGFLTSRPTLFEFSLDARAQKSITHA
ncbi:SubName: Full=Uncharacterized protein {ECO:0000313/EMBL:CCA70910.1} [Serendipita indica DSM 11827]|nr:SubName: Full=Uncharacterized protein {ECO:0000313/EMBL:CCA70910.1} [Serendipita indica DSM 11827]